MSKFVEDAKAATRPPDVTVQMKPAHFLASFSDAPVNPFRLGLRQISLADIDSIREAIQREAASAAESGVSYDIEQATMTGIVARAICAPTDATRPHDVFSCPEDLLPIALRPDAIKWLFDELEKNRVETSPIYPEANDVSIDFLCSALAGGALATTEAVDPVRAKRIRRYLDFVLTELEIDA